MITLTFLGLLTAVSLTIPYYMYVRTIRVPQQEGSAPTIALCVRIGLGDELLNHTVFSLLNCLPDT